MTSNINKNIKNIGFNSENIYNEDTYDISFINRIDEIIPFKELTSKDILTIINKKIEQLTNKYNYANIIINNNIINELIDSSEYTKYGARKIEKIIKNKLEPIIIDNLIDNKTTININSLFSK